MGRLSILKSGPFRNWSRCWLKKRAEFRSLQIHLRLAVVNQRGYTNFNRTYKKHKVLKPEHVICRECSTLCFFLYWRLSGRPNVSNPYTNASAAVVAHRAAATWLWNSSEIVTENFACKAVWRHFPHSMAHFAMAKLSWSFRSHSVIQFDLFWFWRKSPRRSVSRSASSKMMTKISKIFVRFPTQLL